MELHHLKLFNAVASTKSYTRASEKLHITQPALSMQIKKLETELGLKLFDKIGNKLYLNTNGKTLYQYTSQIFELVDQAEHELMNLKGYIGGTLDIGGSNTPGTYILPKLIGQFKTLYPDVKVNLHIGSTEDIKNAIERGDLDFAVNGGAEPYEEFIEVKNLMKDQLIIVASPMNPITKKSPLEPGDFSQEQFIVHETTSQLYKHVYAFAQELGLEKNISTVFGSISAIKQAVAANLGISLIPLSAATVELKTCSLMELHLNGKEMTYQYALIHNKNKYLSPAAKLLMKAIEDNCKRS